MDIDNFLDAVSAHVYGCPDVVMRGEVINAIREFCDRTHVWQKEADSFTLKAGYTEYPIDLPPGAEMANDGLIDAEYLAAPVDIVAYRDLPIGWESQPGSGITSLASRDRRSVVVNPPPVADDSNPVTVTVALRPMLSATTCGDILGDYTEAIAYGAAYRLKMMPKRDWTDREAAVTYRGLFMETVAMATRSAVTGNSENPMVVRPE